LILNMINWPAALNLAARPEELVCVAVVDSPGRMFLSRGRKGVMVSCKTWPPFSQRTDSVLLQ
jgi:hypothetical protein